jgi:hypothetical protein
MAAGSFRARAGFIFKTGFFVTCAVLIVRGRACRGW